MNSETRPPFLDPDPRLLLFFFFVLQLLLLEFLLMLEARLKGWDKNWLGNLAEFLCYDFSSFE
jgi:hypothetical protein